MSTTTATVAKHLAARPFVELEPEIVEIPASSPEGDAQPAPQPTYYYSYSQTDIEAQRDADRARARNATLSASGPTQISVGAISGRINLRPSNREAGRLFDMARAGLGRTWDQKRRTHVYHLDTFCRRGTAQFDSIELIAAMFGLPLVKDESVARTISRYQARLDRQLRPIPRDTWVDDEPDKPITIEAEYDLGTPMRRRWS